MSFNLYRTWIAALVLLSTSFCHSQTTVTLGAEEFQSTAINMDAPYNSQQTSLRSQTIVSADELTAQGLTVGEFTSVHFNVDVLGSDPTLDGFSMRIGPGDGNFDLSFETLATEVIPAADFTPVTGWNEHVFSTPYFWDGVSDLVIETCYQNMGPGGSETSIWFSFTGNETYKEADHFGGNPACDDNNAEDIIIARPQLRLTWQPPMAPPVADIFIQSIGVCNGEILLQDNSQFFPDTWLWYFGDGNTSTDENPMHTYTQNGTYSLSLVVTNAFGTDSITLVDAVTISLTNNIPTSANCSPSTLDQTLGFGVTQLNLNGQTVNSSNGTAGYEDLTCTLFQLDEGGTYQMDVTVAGPADNHVAAWIDYNADGDFTTDEKIFSQVTGTTASESFTLAPSALNDSTLRMRVVSDFYLLGEPDPCADIEGGQAEDYSIRITPNVLPPVAIFSAAPTYSCSGTIQFTDESENVPTGWLWQFGDGNFSTDQNIEHTYTMSGTYTVSLTVQNGFGQDDTVMTDLITVDLGQALTPACAVQTLTYCCGYGLQNFTFEGINNTSPDGSIGYEDHTCEMQAEVTEGLSYPVTAFTGNENPQDLHIYVDMNDDGSFNSSELLFSSLNANSHSGMISFPLQSPVTGSRLRMRVVADFVGNNNDGCTDTQFGQIEDYAIIIHPDTTPPVAGFSANATLTCDGMVSFTNTSNNYSSSQWYFGDSGTSTDTSPTYTYTSEGTFTVSLVVTNDYGMDSLAFEDYITVNFSAACDTVAMPMTGTGTVLTSCLGYLSDDGGPYDTYSNNSSGTQTIDVGTGNYVRLDFSDFSFQFNNDFLMIYDGPDASAPLIGQYTGNALPNGGIIESSGSTITLVQITNFFGVNDGFLLEWTCLPLGLDKIDSNAFSVFPNPAEDLIQIKSESNEIIKSIGIFDLQGRIVLRPAVWNEPIDISRLPQGNFLVRILSENGQTTKPLIIR